MTAAKIGECRSNMAWKGLLRGMDRRRNTAIDGAVPISGDDALPDVVVDGGNGFFVVLLPNFAINEERGHLIGEFRSQSVFQRAGAAMACGDCMGRM